LLDDWGISDNTPKKSFTIKDEDMGDAFIERWKDTYESYQWNTPHISQAILHLVVGQLPAIRDMRIYTSPAHYEDGRVHVLWLQPSGTGKQGAIDFTSRICESIRINDEPLKFETPDDFTDPSLLGGFEEVKMWDASQRGYVTDRIPIEGWLSAGVLDIFAMPEASLLFEARSQYKENMMVYFQRAMDPIGRNRLTRKLLHGDKIYVDPTCSFLLTSYIPPSFTKRVMERGLVQRMVPIINPVPINQRLDNMITSVKKFNTDREDVERIETNMEYLSYYLTQMNKRYMGIKRLESDKETSMNMKAIIYDVQELLDDLPAYQQEELSKFTNRCLSYAFKITYHHTMLRGDTRIRTEDIAYSRNYLFPIWRQLINYMQEALEDNTNALKKELKFDRAISNAFEQLHADGYGKNGWVVRDMLVNYVSKHTRKQKAFISQKIKDGVKNGVFEEGIIENKNIKIIKRVKEVEI
jgi:hypothetical protein